MYTFSLFQSRRLNTVEVNIYICSGYKIPEYKSSERDCSLTFQASEPQVRKSSPLLISTYSFVWTNNNNNNNNNNMNMRATYILRNFNLLEKIDWLGAVWNIVLYGLETWTLRKLERKYLESFEMW